MFFFLPLLLLLNFHLHLLHKGASSEMGKQ